MYLIRVALLSRDSALEPLLASAMGSEFEFFSEPDEEGLCGLIEAEECHIVLLDLSVKHDGTRDGIESARRILARHVALIVLADDSLRTTADNLVRQGAFGYCRRPPSIRDLRILLRSAHESIERRLKFEDVQKRIDEASARHEMVGSSPAIQQVHDLIERVASIDASVLISGDSGTGKELVARAIHKAGTRARKPFVAVACGAIPETLIESELFGHEKGAFTGTVGAREGFFEQAADGTLLLDEIGELSLYTQVKLLRVFQQREFSRLGSNRLIPMRARLLFATHRNLAEMVSQGKFRQDLYYRINVMKVMIPSLQERVEDIAPIARHFVRRYADLFQKRIREIDPEAIALLEGYPWPGNVRELENVIQYGIIMAQSDVLRPSDLPVTLKSEAIPDSADCIPGGSFERQIRDYKIRLAEKAVRENDGNKTLAARSLSISRTYLHRLLRLADPAATDTDSSADGTGSA
jgi:DNA-binding NtrC family response regulator